MKMKDVRDRLIEIIIMPTPSREAADNILDEFYVMPKEEDMEQDVTLLESDLRKIANSPGMKHSWTESVCGRAANAIAGLRRQVKALDIEFRERDKEVERLRAEVAFNELLAPQYHKLRSKYWDLRTVLSKLLDDTGGE